MKYIYCLNKKIIKKNFSSFGKKGITILELLIVIAILTVLFVVVLTQFSSLKEEQALNSSTENVTSALVKARSKTLAFVDSSEYGVHFQSDKVIIYKGVLFSAVDPNNEVIDILSPATISNISLTGGAVDVYFSRFSGFPNVTGSITISNQSSQKNVIIGATGLIDSN